MLFLKLLVNKAYIFVKVNSLIMAKKGDFSWEQIGKIALAVLFFVILLIILGLLTRKTGSIFDTIKDFMRFGR